MSNVSNKLYFFDSFKKTVTDYSSKGRASKLEYGIFLIWWFLITVILVTVSGVAEYLLFGMITPGVKPQGKDIGIITVMVSLSVIFLIIESWLFVVSAFLSIRRFHDINLSGILYWLWIFAALMFCIAESPIMSGFLLYSVCGGLLVLTFVAGYPKANKYGEPPIIDAVFTVKEKTEDQPKQTSKTEINTMGVDIDKNEYREIVLSNSARPEDTYNEQFKGN